jgi:hypothetical protein
VPIGKANGLLEDLVSRDIVEKKVKSIPLMSASEYLYGLSEWCLTNRYLVSQSLEICISGCHL